MAEVTQFLSSVQKSNIREALHIIKVANVVPHLCLDSRGYTALHISALNGSYRMASFLINYTKKHAADAEETIVHWVNMKTEEEFTALHFAAFKGNIKLVKFLVELGIDINARNRQGLNVLHIAAQGDQPLILAYMKRLGMSVLIEDLKGSTPLHWAAYIGSEMAANYLIAIGSPLDKQDHEGYSPLHLSTLSAHKAILRSLLVRGADRGLKDTKNRRPADIAIENSNHEIAKLLKAPGLFSECKIRPPLRPAQPSYLSVIVFILLYVGGNTVHILFHVSYEEIISYVYFGACFFALVFFLILLFRDPGTLKGDDKVSLYELYERYDVNLVCPYCQLFRPARSRHCQCCDRCVSKYDHHCPWVNNCIGAKNLGIFLCFVILIWSSLGLNIATNILLLISGDFDKGILQIEEIWSFAVCVAILVIASAFFIPVSILLIVQCQNFSKNRTTNERYAKRTNFESTVLREEMVSFVTHDETCMDNWKNMCCNVEPELRSNDYRSPDDYEIEEGSLSVMDDLIV